MTDEKIFPPDRIARYCEQLRNENAVIVFTNGVFDLLHPGHVAYLNEAGRLGSHLIVGLNSDDSVRRIKGEKRPLMQLEDRLEILSALCAVSVVTWFEEDTPARLIEAIRPKILVKGADWKREEIVGKDFVESIGGRVLTIPILPGYSTTHLIERICRLSKIT